MNVSDGPPKNASDSEWAGPARSIAEEFSGRVKPEGGRERPPPERKNLLGTRGFVLRGLAPDGVLSRCSRSAATTQHAKVGIRISPHQHMQAYIQRRLGTVERQ